MFQIFVANIVIFVVRGMRVNNKTLLKRKRNGILEMYEYDELLVVLLKKIRHILKVTAMVILWRTASKK